MRKTLLNSGCLLSVLLFSAGCSAVSKTPDTEQYISGQWQVKEVHINTLMPFQPDVLPNDPELVGRTVQFNDDKISGAILTPQGCVKPKYSKSDGLTLDSLLQKTSEEDAEKINAKNYSLSVAGSTRVEPVIVSCSEGVFGPKGNKIGNWLVKLDADTLLTNQDSDSYLVLKKLPAHPQPNPTFSCAKAGTATEKAICSSFELASWDRSVSNAYKMALSQIKNSGDDSAKQTSSLNAKQRAWLKERNACGADVNCLEAKMRERITSLVDIAKG